MKTYNPDCAAVAPTWWQLICISSPELRDTQIAGETLFGSVSVSPALNQWAEHSSVWTVAIQSFKDPGQNRRGWGS